MTDTKMEQGEVELNDLEKRLRTIKHIILVMSGKGGVGKSTVACQMALSLCVRGASVGILDVDICGPSVPKIIGCEGREVVQSEQGWIPVAVPVNLPGSNQASLKVISIGFLIGANDAVVWRGPRKSAMITQFLTDVQWGDLDYLVIDTPPGTSDEHFATAQNLLQAVQTLESKLRPTSDSLAPSSSLCTIAGVLVTTPQMVSVDDVKKEISFCRTMKLPILGIVENMSGYVCPHCACCTDIFSSGGGRKLAEEYNLTFLGKIPIDPALADCEDDGDVTFIATVTTALLKTAAEASSSSNPTSSGTSASAGAGAGAAVSLHHIIQNTLASLDRLKASVASAKQAP